MLFLLLWAVVEFVVAVVFGGSHIRCMLFERYSMSSPCFPDFQFLYSPQSPVLGRSEGEYAGAVRDTTAVLCINPF